MATQPMRRIEAFYPPEQLQTATPGRRLGGYVLDLLVTAATFGIGWLIWFLVVAQRGQTPGKQMLGMYIMREDGTRAGGWYTILREVIVKGLISLVIGVISAATGGLGSLLWLPAALWCTWDRERQCLWDKAASTYIAHSPEGYRPPTAADLRMQGEEPPAMSGRTTAAPDSPSGLMDYPRARTGLEEDPLERDMSTEALADTPSTGESNAASRLRELQRLRDEGLITPEQYEERRAAILDEL
ncbi:MAG: hypothetical protein F4Z25_12130 [Chloroflexi bacterium]|nr:hypothetical protein [Chloroflexota bacterium]